jgi:hypothetical protein
MYSCIRVLRYQRNLALHLYSCHYLQTGRLDVATSRPIPLHHPNLTHALAVSLIISCQQFNVTNFRILERSLRLYGDVHFKQRTVTEFFMTKGSVMLIHRRIKNVYGLNAVV